MVHVPPLTACARARAVRVHAVCRYAFKEAALTALPVIRDRMSKELREIYVPNTALLTQVTFSAMLGALVLAVVIFWLQARASSHLFSPSLTFLDLLWPSLTCPHLLSRSSSGYSSRRRSRARAPVRAVRSIPRPPRCPDAVLPSRSLVLLTRRSPCIETPVRTAARAAKSRRLRYVADGSEVQPPPLEPGNFHLFLSHTWAQGQSDMRIVKQVTKRHNTLPMPPQRSPTSPARPELIPGSSPLQSSSGCSS